MEKKKELKDELKPEYDLLEMRVRKVGDGRKSFDAEDMLDENKFDYLKAKSDRFAQKHKQLDKNDFS